jgi:hypothetical protein
VRVSETKKQQQNLVNNALLISRKEIDPKRIKYLGGYARAMMEPLIQHVEDAELDLSAQDALFICLSLATIMLSKQTGNTKIPTFAEAVSLYTPTEEDD